MAERKTELEKLAELEKKIQQLTKQKNEIEKREKEKARKARTRRLIEIGALSEKYFNCENIDPVDYETFLSKIVLIEQVKSILPNTENSNS